MHEASIALSILAAVEEVYRKTPKARKITRLHLRVGALTLIDVESLKFALKVASRGTPAEGAIVDVEIEEPRFRCRRCGFEWGLDISRVEEVAGNLGLLGAMHIYPDIIVEHLKCPRCGSGDIEIVRGNKIVLDKVEIDAG